MSCVGHPVSWLLLERYHLKELPEREAARVAEHLACCPACAACSLSIEEDARSLPALPVRTPSRVPSWLTWPRLAMAAGAVAAAVLVALWVRPPEPHPGIVPVEGITYKGGELTLTVVREREGAVVENPVQYRSGDRFRLLATLPGPEPMPWDVVVIQSGEIYFPYERGGKLGPVSREPLPGAFRITGNDPAEICLIAGDPLPDRADLRNSGKDALPENVVCHTLEAVE